MDNQQAAKPHLALKAEIIDYRHFPGSNPAKPRPSTKIMALLMLPDGAKTYGEFFMDGTHHLQPGLYNLGLRVGADYNKRLSVSVVSFAPSSDKG